MLHDHFPLHHALIADVILQASSADIQAACALSRATKGRNKGNAMQGDDAVQLCKSSASLPSRAKHMLVCRFS